MIEIDGSWSLPQVIDMADRRAVRTGFKQRVRAEHIGDWRICWTIEDTSKPLTQALNQTGATTRWQD